MQIRSVNNEANPIIWQKEFGWQKWGKEKKKITLTEALGTERKLCGEATF